MASPDWEAIESAYRAGLLSIREIASQQGITHGAINKRAKRDGWERDLKAKIKAKADALVSKREVSNKVSTETATSERILIEANAKVIATVRMEHRGDIRRARTLANSLFDELGAQCGDVAALEQLGDLMFDPDDNGRDRLNELYHKVIGLERQAYDIDGPTGDDTSKKLSDLMDDLAKG